MHGRRIRGMLQELCRVLSNGRHGFVDATYVVSKRGVPYVRVPIGTDTYDIVFFGKTGIFRIYDTGNQHHWDFVSQEGVIDFLYEERHAIR
jgi:hypothetical protein